MSTPLRFSSSDNTIRPSLAGPPRSGRKLSLTCKAVCADMAPPLSVNQRGSLYEVLRVKRNASLTEIKTAYRSLAKLYHPDAVVVSETGAAESDGRDFIEIHNAYATLSDPTARAMYDQSLSSRRRPFVYGGDGGYVYGSGFYPTRNWETDQCW